VEERGVIRERSVEHDEEAVTRVSFAKTNFGWRLSLSGIVFRRGCPGNQLFGFGLQISILTAVFAYV
jgi:hypothetical protein